jgi:hypothetical protein
MEEKPGQLCIVFDAERCTGELWTVTSTDADGDAAVALYAADFQTVSLGTEVHPAMVQKEPDGDGTCLATTAVSGEVERAGMVQGVLEISTQHWLQAAIDKNRERPHQ